MQSLALHHHLRFPHDHVYIPASVVALSLAAAACYALAAVLQQRSAARQPRDLAMRAGLLIGLLRQPVWLLGNVADGGGYLFQFLALRRGSLALVEPLMVFGLLFALPAGAVFEHRRPSGREWYAGSVVVVGLIVFLAMSRPGPGAPRASALGWALLSMVVAGAVVGAALLGRGSARRRAVWLAAGAAVLFGYTAAVTEAAGHLLNHGVIHALASPAPYVLIAGGVVGTLLAQSAFQAGSLRLSLPTLTVVQPLVAIAIGQVLFGEHLATRGAAPLGEAAGLVLMVAGVFALAQSPAIADPEAVSA